MVGRMIRAGTRRVNADLAVGKDVLPPCGRHRRYFGFSEYKIHLGLEFNGLLFQLVFR